MWDCRKCNAVFRYQSSAIQHESACKGEAIYNNKPIPARASDEELAAQKSKSQQDLLALLKELA